MPRDEFLIQTFNKGIQSGYDQADIPEGAAAWSIDEHPESIPGTVQPRMADTAAFDTNNNYCIEKHAWITREDGKRDLVFYDAKAGTVQAITDFHGTPAYGSTLGTPTGTSISMNTHNRAVRVGQGNYASKYVGYIDQGQFGGAAPSATGLSYEDAELAPPAVFPSPYKTVSDATYVYGIEWQGKKLLKITAATGAHTESTLTFNSLQGICDCDATYLYLLDSIGNFGNLYKMKKSDLTIYETYHITGWGSVGVAGITALGPYARVNKGLISDIEITSNKMWFSFWTDDEWDLNSPYSAITNMILNVSLSSLTANADIIPTDITFTSNYWAGTGAGTIGDFTNYTPFDGFWVKPVKTPFIKTDVATEIGWYGKIGAVVINVTGAGQAGNYGIIFMDESAALGDTLNSTHTKFRQLNTGSGNYTQGIKLAGSVNTDYFLAGAGTANMDIYHSTGADEFTLGDAAWTVSTDTTPKSFTPSSSISKTVVGSLTDITASVKSISTKDVTTNILSTVSGNGKYCQNVIDTTAFSMGTSTYIKTTPVQVALTDTTNTDGLFDITKRYFYKIAYRYDGYQISPLQNVEPETVTVASATNSIDVLISLYGTFAYKRATDVLIYRAESSATTNYTPETLYRLAGSISLENNWSTDASESGTWGNKVSFSFTDYGNYGSSYETDSGCPETLHNNTMDYTISCMGGGYHFVGQAYNDELDKVANLVFRSKKNSPDAFDWSNDFCVLPTMPIALHYFKGYVYAFDNSRMYVLDAESLVLIGEYEGYGVQGPLAVCSNESAMFFANADNIYMHDGKYPQIISLPINVIGTSVSGATSHRTLVSTRTISMAISSYSNSLIVAYFKYSATLDTYTPMFIYHLPTQSWRYWNLGNPTGTNITYNTADKRSLIIDYLGRAYISVYKGIVKLLGSSSGTTCTWYSKLINFGDQTTLNKIYKILWDGSVTTATADFNNAQTFAESLTSGAYMASPSTKRSSLQLKFTMADGKYLRGITIIFRKMIGLR